MHYNTTNGEKLTGVKLIHQSILNCHPLPSRRIPHQKGYFTTVVVTTGVAAIITTTSIFGGKIDSVRTEVVDCVLLFVDVSPTFSVTSHFKDLNF